MFNNLGVHVIDFPSGKFGFVGTIPTVLADMVPATIDDIRAGRAFIKDGTALTPKFPVFESAIAAAAFAKSRGVEVA